MSRWRASNDGRSTVKSVKKETTPLTPGAPVSAGDARFIMRPERLMQTPRKIK